MTKIETETVINFNDAENIAHISTRQRRIKNHLRKLGILPTDKQADYECFDVPIEWISIRPRRKASEKQKEAARRNILKAHKK